MQKSVLNMDIDTDALHKIVESDRLYERYHRQYYEALKAVSGGFEAKESIDSSVFGMIVVTQEKAFEAGVNEGITLAINIMMGKIKLRDQDRICQHYSDVICRRVYDTGTEEENGDDTEESGGA